MARTTHELDALLRSGVLGVPMERIGGRWVMGTYSFCFSREQARAADEAGVRMHPTAVDAVLADPQVRAEVIARPRAELGTALGRWTPQHSA